VAKRLSIPLVVGVLGTALVGLLIYGIATQAPSRSLDEALKHDSYPQAPSATQMLPRLSGAGGESLAGYRGKVVVLNFWASWCEPCQEEAPLLERAERKLARHDGTVLGVTYLDVTPDSLSFVKRYHLTYPNLRDTSGEFTHSYGTDQLPESFVINREGHVVALERGEIDEAFLNRAVSLAESS
jgi:cytochrome c biogenesis protein CcmG/thiol:disulfide interchange protein DsbE